MPETTELTRAYISLIPSLDGANKAITKELNKLDTTSVGKSSGKKMGNGMRTGLAGVATKVVAPIAAAFAGMQIIDFFGDSINEASDLGESVNALNVVFGDASDEISKLGESASKSLGLSNVEFNSLATQFSNFVQTIAGEGGDVVGTMDELTTRAADFASVMNLDVAEAASLFQSGLAGESEPLRKYGIDLSAAAVEAYAYANGIAESGEALTEAQKVQARYGSVMEQTNKVAGDFANTSDSLANQQRIASAEFANVKAELGEKLLPIVTEFFQFLNDKAIPALSGLIDWLGGLGDTFSGVTDAVGENKEFVEVVQAVWDGLSDTFNNVIIPVAKDLWRIFQKDILPVLKDVWAQVEKQLKPTLNELAAFIRKYVSPAVKEYAKYLGEVWKWVAKYVIPIVTKLAGFLTGAWLNAIRMAIQAVGWLIDRFVQFRDSASRAFSTVKIVAKAAFNQIAAFWNRTVGSLSFTAPDWLGGGSWGVAKIPMLATGGLVTAPTIAMIGEGAHPEVVRTVPDYIADLERAANSGGSSAADLDRVASRIVNGVLEGSKRIARGEVNAGLGMKAR